GEHPQCCRHYFPTRRSADLMASVADGTVRTRMTSPDATAVPSTMSRPPESISRATPVTVFSPGSSTRTCRPSVEHRDEYDSSRPARFQWVYSATKLRTRRRSTTVRSDVSAPDKSKDVAVGTGNSAVVSVALSPIPMTAALALLVRALSVSAL